VAHVARAFSLSPSAASFELGVPVLSAGRRRLLTLRVSEALRAEKVVSEWDDMSKQMGEAGADATDEQKAAIQKGTVGNWTEDDGQLFRELMYAVGRTTNMRGV